MVDIEKGEVLVALEKLHIITQLEEVCTHLNLVVPESKKDKVKASQNAIRRYLSSEELEDSADEGLEIFQKLNVILKKMVGDDSVPADGSGGGVENSTSTSGEQEKQQEEKLKQQIRVKIQQQQLQLQKQLELLDGNSDDLLPISSGTVPISPGPISQVLSTGTTTLSTSNPSVVSGTNNSLSAIEVKKIKIRDFKITNGAVGRDKGCIQWGSLCFQMKQGLIQGYGERDIMLGVISAMKEGSSEKTYFQLSLDDADMSHETFLGMLRSLYGVEDSEKLMDKMKAYSQGPTMSLKTYVMEMSSFRRRILSAVKHESSPSLTEESVRKKFVHLLLVGLRDPTTRLELKAVLNADSPISDHDLMAVVDEISACGQESEEKFGRSVANAKAVDVDVEKDHCTREEGKIVAELSKLNVTLAQQQVQYQQQQKTIENLQRQLNSFQPNNNNDNQQQKKKKFPGKCEKCQADGSFCNHCCKCGELGHKKANCPKNE